jgi:hypothetical protein
MSPFKSQAQRDEYDKQYREAHHEEINRSHTSWQRAHPGRVSGNEQLRLARQERYIATPGGQRTRQMARIRSRYGITSDEWRELWESQSGRCGLCHVEMVPNGRSGRSATVDHDHGCCPTYPTCGKCVVGLLCMTCNADLGKTYRIFSMIGV